MPIIPLVRRISAVQYTGANSAEVQTLFAASFLRDGGGHTAVVASANGSQCVINEVDVDAVTVLAPYQVLLNSWVIVNFADSGLLVLTSAQMNERYMGYNDASALMSATDSFKTAVAATASGFGALSSITVNGLSNANFDIPIRPMQPSNSFTATPFLTGGASLLGSLAMTGLSGGAIGTVQNAQKLTTVIGGVTWYDRVRVNVANSGALQITGANLLCHVSP